MTTVPIILIMLLGGGYWFGGTQGEITVQWISPKATVGSEIHWVMRRLADLHRIKGIALSGFGMQDDVRRSKDAGFAAHLTKPVDVDVLEETLREIAGR